MKPNQILILIIIYAIWRYSQQKQTVPVASNGTTTTTTTTDATLRRDMEDMYSLVNDKVAKKLDQWQVSTKAAAVTLTTKLTSPAMILVLADESQAGARALYYWDNVTLEEIIKA